MFPLTAQFNNPDYVGEVIALKPAEYRTGKPILGHSAAVLRETAYEGYNKTIFLKGSIPDITAHIRKAQDEGNSPVDLSSITVAKNQLPEEPKSWLEKILG